MRWARAGRWHPSSSGVRPHISAPGAAVTIQKIVVGIDFEPPSLAAAAWVIRHFAPQADVVLVHGVRLPRPPGFVEKLFPLAARPLDALCAAAEARLREAAARLGRDDLGVVVEVGRPAEVLAAAARAAAADLIVVADHGHRRGFDLPGATADRVVRDAPVAVLVARALPDRPPARVLAPVDEERAMTARVLAWAAWCGQRFGAEVTAHHALSPLVYRRLRSEHPAAREPDFEERLTAAGGEWLAARLAEAGLPRTADARVTIGDPRYDIPALAERLDADLVIVGKRSGDTVSHVILGSVASAVLRATGCSVLLVPPE
jgi:universal stress protein E